MSTDEAVAPRSATVPSEPAGPGTEIPRSVARRSLERMWLAIAMLTLSLAVFAQSAGNTAADTKIDLVISPLRFLGRALRLWDPTGNAGQLQNQAYGYLFPIGPFYAVLHAMGVAPWEMQRAFESTIVCLAFLGTYRLARRMGIDSFWPALGAGLAYALAPRVLSELTSISAELMPVAALPWVMIPLVDGAAGGSPRRAAMRSGIALLFAGGVNAAATLAILPAPALWLLTRTGGPRRRALMGWWTLAVVLACAWWAIPLALLGRYSPPFLDWVESSSTTTAPTSLLAVLRGVDHWEGYLGPGIWPGGWILVAGRAAILATSVVAAIGLIGIARRRVPHALFLWSCLLLGLIVITAGHAAKVGPPGASGVRHLLDGSLVPFRNLHKFDPLVRLPLAIGVGHVLLRLSALRDRHTVTRGIPVRVPTRLLAYGLVAVVGAVAVSPVWTNHLVSKQRITPEASWWASAAKWLHAHSDGRRALVVPGSASPNYVWGGTVDDALQPVATTPWTVRGAVPLSQAGYIRLLDDIETTMAGGAADPGLAPLLARAGIGYVVLANDLEPLASQATPLVYVRATLETSPGLHLRAGFGQPIGGSLSPSVSVDAGGTVARPGVQIFSVDGGAGRASLQPLSSAVTATGSSDTLAQLVDRGLGADQAVLFGRDGDGLAVPHAVTTDGIRRREASFAGSLTPSATMTQQQLYSQSRPQHDYLPSDPGPLSAYRYTGIADVTASSSGADGLAFVNRGPRNGPWSALDGDPGSSWQSTALGAVGQWLEVRFDHPITAATADIRFGLVDDGPAPLPTEVLVTTDAGTAREEVLPLTDTQQLRLPKGPTTRLRVTIARVARPGPGASVAIASLTVPGVHPGRTLVVPSRPGSDLFAFDAAPGYRSECLQLRVGTVCDPLYAASGQEDSGIDRTFSSGRGDFFASATVRMLPGSVLDRRLDAGLPVTATASSVNSADPRQRAGAAVDGDPNTIWQAAAGDIKPLLSLALDRPRFITGLTVTTPASAPVAAPLAVSVRVIGPSDAETWSGDLPADGHIVLDRGITADRVSIQVDLATVRTSVASVGGRSRLLAIGIGDVELDGAPRPQPDPTLHVPCAEGPIVEVDGVSVPMQIDASRADVLAGRPVTATACSATPIALTAGPHRIDLAASDQAMPVSVTLARAGFGLGSTTPANPVRVVKWQSTDRAVRVATASAALLVVHENANPGWTATLHGQRLRSVRVDGWEQGFVVPAGARGTVVLRFAPQRGFELGLVAGALAVLALGLLAFARRRPPARPAPALADARPVAVVMAVGLAAAAGLLAGVAGVITVAAVGVAALVVGRSARPWAPVAAGALLAIAGLVVSRAGPTQIFAQQNSGQVQLLCVAALAIGATSGFVRRRRTRVE